MVSAIPFTIIHQLDTFSVQIYRVYEDVEKQTIRQDESRSRDKAEERRPVQGKNVSVAVCSVHSHCGELSHTTNSRC